MTKRTVLQQIDGLIDGTCAVCPKRIEFYQSKRNRGKYSLLDSYCNKKCETGNRLQSLGKTLVTI